MLIFLKYYEGFLFLMFDLNILYHLYFFILSSLHIYYFNSTIYNVSYELTKYNYNIIPLYIYHLYVSICHNFIILIMII
jgi:hypothetical protein